MTSSSSPFFDVPQAEWIAANRSAFAIWDAYPVSEGHALVVTRRQISHWWDATAQEKSDIFELVDVVRDKINDVHEPDGFNVGFNAGEAAGQTVDHLHVHIIPRSAGDVADPRGGVRHVIPSRGNYLSSSELPGPPSSTTDIHMATPVLVDGQVRMLLPELVEHLRNVDFDQIDIVVSFIKMSGLKLLLGPIEDALGRGARIRVLTTDYLGLTEPAALARLHDLMEDAPDSISVRLFHDPEISFHPKAYLFYSASGAEAAFVGSSNLSGQGLNGGMEWNLLVGASRELRERFLVLWLDPRSLPLTDELIASYEPAPTHIPDAVEVIELPEPLPEPRPIQQEALRALSDTRLAGFRAGMVTMATGLGKTWLAAFDAHQAGASRVLFIAHREEILKQSRDVFRRVNPEATMGLYFGGEKDPDADFVFATVQTLSGRLEHFDANAFDYIVVDEFHHAAATTYRSVLDHFAPRFLLGLTATPERMDGADLLSLCADNLVFDCDLIEGIRRDELVPFRYWGVPDPVDFEPIPWRNGRFDPAALEAAIETQDRARAAFHEWQSRRGTRTLAFCASKHHADFMSDFFAEHGVRCVSVHSGPSSAPRHQSLEALRTGELEVIFTVDLFNEGLDLPDIDTVLMLRPTESPVIFLQQLGRGLRIREGKDALTVIDFIGNHRSFLLKPRTLLGLSRYEHPSTLQIFAALESKDFGLPAGCSVDYDLTVIDMLKALSRNSVSDSIEEYCRSYISEEGFRPTPTQVLRAGYDPAAVKSKYGGWFEFLLTIELLGEQESRVVQTHGDTLNAFQTESVTKSYKLIAIRALLHENALRTGAGIAANAEVSRQLLLADPRLAREVPVTEFPALATASADKWAQYWRKWPIAHLTGAATATVSSKLFQLDGERIAPTFDVDPSIGDLFDAMVAEIIEYRLASYLLTKDSVVRKAWACRIVHSDGQPVVRLDRRQSPDLPDGDLVITADDASYTATFGGHMIASASHIESSENALPDLLRSWFGPSAGHPGTSHAVTIEQIDDVLTMEPVRSASTRAEIDYVPLFGNYEIACAPSASTSWDEHASAEVAVRRQSARQVTADDHFVCFAHDDSMNGGANPIRHGDPLLFEWIKTGSTDNYRDQPVLINRGDGGGSAALRVLRRTDSGLVIESSNPTVPTIEAGPGFAPVARLISKLEQDAINPLAPLIGEQYKSTDVPPLYGEVYNSGNWRSGHVSLKNHAVLFVSLQKRNDRTQYAEHFEAPDVFVWSSQLSTSPTRKKGREILEAMETGKSIELWMRRKGNDLAFTYLGRVVPLGHEGSEPMLVTFRLLTALSGELQTRLGYAEHLGGANV